MLAVTTRSHLKSVRFFPLMLAASLRIRRQLRATRGCLRFASIVAGPREFWTVTAWRTRHEMLDFMRSGAHEDIMWLFARWLDSFWLMRWLPTEDEVGRWDGLSLRARPSDVSAPQRDEQQQRAFEAALDHVPGLKDSVGPSGAPSYDYAPHVRRRRHQVAGGVGTTVRIAVPRLTDAPQAWRGLWRLRRGLGADPGVLRFATGVSRSREVYALVVLRDEDAAGRFLSLPLHDRLRARWPDGYWSMRWDPANEFGHWDDLRLRRERLGTGSRDPEAETA